MSTSRAKQLIQEASETKDETTLAYARDGYIDRCMAGTAYGVNGTPVSRQEAEALWAQFESRVRWLIRHDTETRARLGLVTQG